MATIDVDKKSNHAKSSDLKMELVETDPLAPSRATSAEQIEASVQEVGTGAESVFLVLSKAESLCLQPDGSCNAYSTLVHIQNEYLKFG